jgi:hypothetical protein
MGGKVRTATFLQMIYRFTLLLLLIAACQPAPHILTGNLPIEAPQSITVGDTVNVKVGPIIVSDGTTVGLVMVGKHGPRVYRSTFESGVAQFTIPSEHTLQPGYLALIAAAESARGETGVLLRPSIQPLPSENTNLNIASHQPTPQTSTE